MRPIRYLHLERLPVWSLCPTRAFYNC